MNRKVQFIKNQVVWTRFGGKQYIITNVLTNHYVMQRDGTTLAGISVPKELAHEAFVSTIAEAINVFSEAAARRSVHRK